MFFCSCFKFISITSISNCKDPLQFPLINFAPRGLECLQELQVSKKTLQNELKESQRIIKTHKEIFNAVLRSVYYLRRKGFSPEAVGNTYLINNTAFRNDKESLRTECR